MNYYSSKMSNARRNRRAKHRSTGIDAHKQNKAGFYKGMPGVFLDKHGNRRIYEIRLTPEGEVEGLIGAHPKQVMACVDLLMQKHPQIRSIILLSSRRFRRKRFIKAFLGFFQGLWYKVFKPKKKAPERARMEAVSPEVKENIEKEKKALANKISQGLEQLTKTNTEA